MKKVLSLILCMMILLSAFVLLTAFAEDDAAPTDAASEAETLPDSPRIQIVTNDGNGLSLKKADGYVGDRICKKITV